MTPRPADPYDTIRRFIEFHRGQVAQLVQHMPQEKQTEYLASFDDARAALAALESQAAETEAALRFAKDGHRALSEHIVAVEAERDELAETRVTIDLREVCEDGKRAAEAERDRLTEALRDSERWIHRVAGSELHRLYGHAEPYPTCGDSMCLRARKYRDLANSEGPAALAESGRPGGERYDASADRIVDAQGNTVRVEARPGGELIRQEEAEPTCEPGCVCGDPTLCGTVDPALIAACPKCGALVEDLDGFGVLVHDKCGYCSHPSAYGGVCESCGEVVDAAPPPKEET